MNRAIYGFNQFIDKIALKPAAQTYNFIVPPPLQMGISNAFDNIGEIRTFANDVLQGRFKYAWSDIWRFAINSTIGVGGLFDVASHMGIPKHYEDFGMTLAYWEGGRPSPYLVLPILGPNTFRSGFGKIADFYSAPWPYLKDQTISYIAYATYILNVRSNLLPADKLINTSFDPYIFVRNAYLQKRNRMIRLNEDLDKNIDVIKEDNGTLSPKDYGATNDSSSDANSDIYVDDAVANAPVDGLNESAKKPPADNTKETKKTEKSKKH